MAKVLCIGGPTGAGKDTIVSHFLGERADFVRVPRATTRPLRRGEEEGIDYFFLSAEEFCAREEKGALCAVDTFCGHRYGVDVARILSHLREGRNVIGVFGVCSIPLRAILGDKALLLYITAPVEKLREHLLLRGHTPQEVAMRLDAARMQQQEEPQQFDHILVNEGSVQEAVRSLVALVSAQFDS